jgi:DNA repair protein RecO (recombination protein O)
LSTYRDEGIVLRTMRLGEADRIVTILTAEHGKVRAVAKGVRRTKSRVGGRVEPLSHVALLCWRGRELDVVSQVESIDTFRQIRTDLSRLGPATTILEIADQVAEQHAPAGELYAMVLGALRALESEASPLLLGAFCFKLLAIDGVSPIVDACARCASPGPLVAFDLGEGGLLCEHCRRGQAVSEEFVTLARAVLGGSLAWALRQPTTPATSEVERIGLAAVERHLDRRLRSSRHLIEGEQRGA